MERDVADLMEAMGEKSVFEIVSLCRHNREPIFPLMDPEPRQVEGEFVPSEEAIELERRRSEWIATHSKQALENLGYGPAPWEKE